MGWFLEILAVLMIILYIFTFIAEPTLSMKYTKEYVKSIGTLISKVKGMFDNDEQKEDKTDIQKVT